MAFLLNNSSILCNFLFFYELAYILFYIWLLKNISLLIRKYFKYSLKQNKSKCEILPDGSAFKDTCPLHDDLTLIIPTHMVEGGKSPLHVFFWPPPCIYAFICICIYVCKEMAGEMA